MKWNLIDNEIWEKLEFVVHNEYRYMLILYVEIKIVDNENLKAIWKKQICVK